MNGVVSVQSDAGESKCQMCGFRVTTRYRLDIEEDDEAVCGDCFAQWLDSISAEVSIG